MINIQFNKKFSEKKISRAFQPCFDPNGKSAGLRIKIVAFLAKVIKCKGPGKVLPAAMFSITGFYFFPHGNTINMFDDETKEHQTPL